MKKFAFFIVFLGILGISIYTPKINGQERPRVVELPVDKQSTTAPVETYIEPPPPMSVIDNEDVIKINTNLVKLPVSVFDKNGRFISGLQQNDFQIFENGNEQQIEYFASIENPFTVVLLLDLSPSTKYKINEIQDAAIAFYDELRSDDRLIVVAFSRNMEILSDGNADYNQIRSDIRRAKFGDGTSLYETVDFAMNKVKAIPGRKAIVLFSDGVDTSSRRANFNGTIKQAHSSDALIYSIRYDTFVPNPYGKKVQYGIGGSPEEHQRGKIYLQNLTEFSGGRIYEADTTANLTNAFKNIAEELRRQYSIGYYPENEGIEGERRNIIVRVRRPNLVVRSKGSYVVETAEVK
ncbi:MAG: VWA domain-containing protein [Aridibacter sp.]